MNISHGPMHDPSGPAKGGPFRGRGLLRLLASMAPRYDEIVIDTFGASLLGYWPMGEAAGLVANDLSGHGYHGAYQNITLGQPGIGDGGTVPLWDLVGGDEAMIVSDPGFLAALNGSVGTLSLWFKTDAAFWADDVERCLFSVGIMGSNRLTVHKNANNSLMIGHQGSGVHIATVAPYVNPTGWTHVAVTWDVAGNALRYYLNGIEMNDAAPGVTAWNDTVYALYAGYSNGKPYSGWLAHIAIGNTVLTETQIQTLAWHNHNGFEGLLLCFDDQFGGIWSGTQHMAAHNIPGTMYVSTDNVGIAGRLTEANLHTLEAAGWAMGNHTMSHQVLTTLNQAQQEAELSGAEAQLVAWGFNATNARQVAYPQGGFNALTLAAMTNTGMLTGRTVNGTITYHAVDPRVTHPYVIGMRAVLQSSAIATLAGAQAVINEARARGGWQLLLIHDLADANPNSEQWLNSDFNALIDWIVAENIPCRTIADFYAAR